MELFKLYLCICSLVVLAVRCEHKEKKKGLLIFTVATEPTDGFNRFMRSAKKYALEVKVLGLGQAWKGGDVATTVGGGQKVLLLQQALEAYQNDKDRLVMFVDSYDVVFSANEKEMVKAFHKFNARVVFSAEVFCWPDRSLEDSYPKVKHTEYRFLNSGGFMGFASDIYSLVNRAPIVNADDDQLFYTKAFLDNTTRESLKMKLDTRAEIFQCLNGVLDDVQVKFRGTHSYLYNARTGTVPLVIHGNGPIKIQFNSLANYLADQWTPTSGCQACAENTISLTEMKTEDYPRVLVSLVIDKPTPFVSLFLHGVAELDYPKDKIDIHLHNSEELHAADVEAWREKWEGHYNSLRVVTWRDVRDARDSRNNAIEQCLKTNCKYLFNIDGEVQILNPNLLIHLIEANRSIITPVMTRPGKMWATFWGAINKEGFYKRSQDYPAIIQNERRGLWNVPHVAYVYLIQGHILPKMRGHFANLDMDPDMAFSYNNRKNGLFMFVDNQEEYGYLSNPDDYPTNHLHNDLWEITTNKKSWERQYLHPEYMNAIKPEVEVNETCPDVYSFPMITDIFADQLVAEAENHGGWSDGSHSDPRLAGGYENVPTVDIHMNQIGWEAEWLTLLRTYVAPMANKVYTGYSSDGRATMNFMVRYRPGEQDRLRPHQDTSTYSLNIALNRPGIDFEGGGTRFLRYNCTAHNRKGWVVMHPGRLTHFHEGLKTTSGTRYIMVCFVDP